MFARRLDNWLRVACGACPLWLLVVQEKLWPWLLSPPVPAASARLPGKPLPKSKLPYVVPDTLQSRWSATESQHGLRHSGNRDGVVSCGQQRPNSSDSPDVTGADLAGWQHLQCRIQTVGAIPAPARAPRGQHSAVRTCISITGPPQV